MFDKVYLIKSISAVTNYNSSSCSDVHDQLSKQKRGFFIFLGYKHKFSTIAKKELKAVKGAAPQAVSCQS